MKAQYSIESFCKDYLNYRWEDVDIYFTYRLYHVSSQVFFSELLPDKPIIRFTNSKIRAGSCYFQQYKIHLSNIVIPMAEQPYRFFLETLLHEMVHLLEYCRYGQKPSHGEIFKAHALDISMKTGLNIQSQHFIDIKTNARYIGTCPNCGKQIYRFRKPRNYHVACKDCCRKYNKGEYSNRFRFSFVAV